MGEVVSFEDFRDSWLTDVREGDPSSTEIGHRFARKLLSQWRDLDDTSDDLVYCDGAGDGGIDIAHLYRGEGADSEADGTTEGHFWYLVQSKYGSAFRGAGTLLEEGQKLVDTLDGQRLRLSSLAEGLLERLTAFRRQASERDRIILVFATELPLTSDQKRALEDVRAIGRARLGSIFDVE
ncbi:MAG: AIPR family protein, partial [Dehalococcoidia bacterium]